MLLVNGYKYYIVFVDDFYPLHIKSEAYDAFLKFKLLVENQFSTTIQELQSNGGGKYIVLNFQSFLKKTMELCIGELSLYIPSKWSCRKETKAHS
jgi:hypothetical protein